MPSRAEKINYGPPSGGGKSQKFRTQKPSNGLYFIRHSRSWWGCTAKTEVVVVPVWIVVAVAVHHTQGYPSVVPSTAAQHLIRSSRRSWRVAGGRDAVVIRLIPIVDPFPDVAGQFRCAKNFACHPAQTHPTTQINSYQKSNKGAYLCNSLPRTQFHISIFSGIILVVDRYSFTPSRKMVWENRFHWRNNADKLYQSENITWLANFDLIRTKKIINSPSMNFSNDKKY